VLVLICEADVEKDAAEKFARLTESQKNKARQLIMRLNAGDVDDDPAVFAANIAVRFGINVANLSDLLGIKRQKSR
jgi:hypothetical protein